MIEVSFDGASVGNPGLAGGGVYINSGGSEIRESIPLGVLSSNHEAEFAALVQALQYCLEKGYRSVSFRTDSQLVNQALEKRYVKKAEYAHYLERALTLIDRFDLFFCKWIPDEKNRNADALARFAIRKQQNADKSECGPL
ncbi:reverse transcriptase-like protein [Sporolactobacillus pectinivorans]|uniref:reverse transcriptase-like protein n=1 Tax=Sporolactobacillus pectinivorans TaxID=1591408 RepID=UPI000C267597|nr:reverse transcriptase-like protein [Sporolactobacillus pectinivorans]